MDGPFAWSLGGGDPRHRDHELRLKGLDLVKRLGRTVLHGVPQSAALRVVERLTRVDEDTITWRATIEDPDVYWAPWTVEVPFLATARLRDLRVCVP